MTVFHRVIPERHVAGKRLGRHVKHDERSKDPKYAAPKADAITDVIHKAGSDGWLPLDQGQLGSCTANALVGARMLAPNVGGRGQFTEKSAVWLYRNEQVEQGFFRHTDNGGTGIDVCKCAVTAKWISSYTHTFSLQDALLAQMLRPGLLGCNWYDSMDHPDADGIVSITPRARIRGGHMFVGFRVLAAQQLVGFIQSWGPWGVACPEAGLQTGVFYMSYATLERLLSEQADFTFPIR